jgi:hypothetical protein
VDENTRRKHVTIKDDPKQAGPAGSELKNFVPTWFKYKSLIASFKLE